MKRSPLIDLGIAFVLLIAVLVAYDIWYGMLSTQTASLKSLVGQISQKEGDVARIAAAKTELNTLSMDESAVSGYFVSSSNIVSFLEGLEKAGAPLGATVSVVSVASEQDDARQLLKVSLTIRGSFDAVVRTIGIIEYAPRDISVSTLTLETNGDKPKSGELIWTAAAVFYVGTDTVVQTTP